MNEQVCTRMRFAILSLACFDVFSAVACGSADGLSVTGPLDSSVVADATTSAFDATNLVDSTTPLDAADATVPADASDDDAGSWDASAGLLFDYGALDGAILHADGGVYGWRELLGNDAVLVSDGGAVAPLYIPGALNGYPGVAGVSSPSALRSTRPVEWGDSMASTCFLVAKLGGPNYSFSTSTNANTGVYAYSYSTGFTNLSTSLESTSILPGQYQILTLVTDKAAYATLGMQVWSYWGRSRLGGTSQYVAFLDAGPGNEYVSNPLYLLNTPGLAQPTYETTLVRLRCYDARLTEPEIHAEQDALSAEYGLNASPPTRLLYWDGDSISSANNDTSEATPAHLVLDGAFPGYVMASFAYSGKFIGQGQALAHAAAQIGQLRAGIAKQYAVLWLGTNDLAFYATNTPSSVYADLSTYVSLLRSSGFTEVGVLTTLPRISYFDNGVTAAIFETERQAYNALIRGGATAGGYAVIDVGGDAVFGRVSDAANKVDYPDGTHPSTALGTTIYTQYLAPQLTAWN